MGEKISRLVVFLLAVAALVGGLKIINLLPLILQKDNLQRYGSVEEIRAKLHLKEIFTPTYFPQDLSWPASEILAQGSPYKAVIMEFRNAGKGDISLIICQSESNRVPGQKLEVSGISERVEHLIRGRRAELVVGKCGNEEPCSSLTWNEGKLRLFVIMKSTPSELIRLSESMRP